jgi:hypothetical protein
MELVGSAALRAASRRGPFAGAEPSSIGRATAHNNHSAASLKYIVCIAPLAKSRRLRHFHHSLCNFSSLKIFSLQVRFHDLATVLLSATFNKDFFDAPRLSEEYDRSSDA